jgi:hypothetical protein
MIKKMNLFFVFLTALMLVLLFFSVASGKSEENSAQGYAPNSGAMQAASVQDSPTPTPQAWQMGPGGVYTSTMYGTAATGCPMMDGSMSGGSMTGMNGMSGMSNMSGMNNMSGMGNMTGMQGINDPLMAQQSGFSLYYTNPWWLLGWLVLILVFLSLIAGLVVGVFWLVRRIKSSPAVPAES